MDLAQGHYSSIGVCMYTTIPIHGVQSISELRVEQSRSRAHSHECSNANRSIPKHQRRHVSGHSMLRHISCAGEFRCHFEH